MLFPSFISAIVFLVGVAAVRHGALAESAGVLLIMMTIFGTAFWVAWWIPFAIVIAFVTSILTLATLLEMGGRRQDVCGQHSC